MFFHWFADAFAVEVPVLTCKWCFRGVNDEWRTASVVHLTRPLQLHPGEAVHIKNSDLLAVRVDQPGFLELRHHAADGFEF